jgi:fructoselysine 6-kinase
VTADVIERWFGAIGDNTIDQYVGADTGTYIGGNALNVAMQLRLLGRHVRYAGAIGPDAAGRRIRGTLEQHGVVTAGLRLLNGSTSVSRIRVKNDGERVIEHEDFAVCAHYEPDEPELDQLATCAVVHIGMTPYAASIRAELRRRGATISQDCAVSDGFDHLDVAFCSAGEDLPRAREMAEAALGGGANLAVVTCGALGSVASTGRRWIEHPAHPTRVVDTTGAGDGYIAGFLNAYVDGGTVEDCMRSGATTAALTCQHRGGWLQVQPGVRMGGTQPLKTARRREPDHDVPVSR